jgi:hypothetical protein
VEVHPRFGESTASVLKVEDYAKQRRRSKKQAAYSLDFLSGVATTILYTSIISFMLTTYNIRLTPLILTR